MLTNIWKIWNLFPHEKISSQTSAFSNSSEFFVYSPFQVVTIPIFIKDPMFLFTVFLFSTNLSIFDAFLFMSASLTSLFFLGYKEL